MRLSECLEAIWYLQRNYDFLPKEMRFINKFTSEFEWGSKILSSLSIILGFSSYICEECFREFSESLNMSPEQLTGAFGPSILETSWGTSLAQDLGFLYGFNAQDQMLSVVLTNLGKEIDVQVLRDVRTSSIEEFLGLMRCVGYTISETYYDNNVERKFVIMNYNEIISERNNNSLWQNWL